MKENPKSKQMTEERERRNNLMASQRLTHTDKAGQKTPYASSPAVDLAAAGGYHMQGGQQHAHWSRPHWPPWDSADHTQQSVY